MTKRPHRWVCGLVVFVAMGLLTVAHAGNRKSNEPKRPRTSSGAKAPPSTQESTAERERRLLRECRGRPNAGACLGFAS